MSFRKTQTPNLTLLSECRNLITLTDEVQQDNEMLRAITVFLYCKCLQLRDFFYAEEKCSDLNLHYFMYLPYGIEICHIVYEEIHSIVSPIPSALNISS